MMMVMICSPAGTGGGRGVCMGVRTRHRHTFDSCINDKVGVIGLQAIRVLATICSTSSLPLGVLIPVLGDGRIVGKLGQGLPLLPCFPTLQLLVHQHEVVQVEQICVLSLLLQVLLYGKLSLVNMKAIW